MATTALKMDGTVRKQRPLRPLAERFWEKVNKAPGQGPNGECWEWMGTKIPQGYGYIFIERFEGHRKHQRSTHRVSYELANGPIRDGLHILHACDNPACVNPAHLSTGTIKDNTQDMMRKGRHKTNGNENKTHCIQGHEYTPENTRAGVGGRRHCIACFNIYSKGYKARKRAEKALL